MNETVREVGQVTSAESIDCDFAAKGYVSLARTPAQLARARAMTAGASSFGIKDQWQYLDGAQARAVINADGVLGGVYTRHCALLHPGKLARGLATRVAGLGGTIYENTAVTGIGRGCVRTGRGTVTAPVIVRATEAFTAAFAGNRRTVAPLYSMAVATAPLPGAVRQDLGLDARVAFNDLRNLRIYAHPTADGRLVFGGRGAPYHFGSKVTPRYDVDAGIHGKIIQTLGEFFPALAGAQITHRWGGPLGVPRDWFPSAGYDAATGLAWAGPYVGDGVATSNLAGRILRNLITGRQDELNHLPIVDHASPC